MPQLTVEGFPSVEVETGKRLVRAIEQDAGVDILHACGGNARCTTCRVEFISGEPEMMTVAERTVLAAKGVTGVRLSCQIICDHDMTVRAVSRLAAAAAPIPVGRRRLRSPRRRSGSRRRARSGEPYARAYCRRIVGIRYSSNACSKS